MAIELNISSGKIDQGETKRLQVTPKDEAGDAMAVSALEAVFTPPTGEATTYTLEDFSGSGPYTVAHTFDEAGIWRIAVTATDSEGKVEVERGTAGVNR
jgi:nitrogen fixation protein FixH